MKVWKYPIVKCMCVEVLIVKYDVYMEVLEVSNSGVYVHGSVDSESCTNAYLKVLYLKVQYNCCAMQLTYIIHIPKMGKCIHVLAPSSSLL